MEKWTTEQLEAINKDNTNIIVSAGAGSGKTTVLSQRVIRKLLDGVNINEILILTFTNKAAGEMKDRIRKRISENDTLSSQLSLLDSSYISTFDAFSLSMVKKYSYLLNIGKDISVGDSSLIYLEKVKILEEIFNKYYESNDLNFNSLISNFSMKNDKTIKKSILQISNKLDLKYDSKEFLKNYINNYFNDEIFNKRKFEYSSLLKSKIRELEEMTNIFMDTSIFYDLFKSENYENIKINIDFDFPKVKVDADLKPLHEESKDLFNEIKKGVRYDNLEEIFNETKSYSDIIVKIIIELEERIQEFKNNNRIYDFSDIAKMAIRIVKENDDVREELTNYFNEIMIDEYQDTSDLQEEFIKLIAKNNVYMVGDIKQSIYRFRNANPYLFKSKYDLAKTNDDIVRIDLTNNFRSRELVVNNINTIFSKIMTDDIGGGDYLKDHLMISGNKNYQEIENQDSNLEIINYEYTRGFKFKKEEIEIFIAARDIKNKVLNNYQIYDRRINGSRNIEYSDFAILLDRTKHFDLIKKIFTYLNIPVSKFSSNNVLDSVEISLIKNIMILLLKDNYDLDFKYSFISIARSYLFEYSDEIIFDMVLNNNYDSDLLSIINSIKEDIHSKSLKEILTSIIDGFSFYEKFILVGDVKKRMDDLLYLINLVESISNYSYTISDFIIYIEKLKEEGYKLDTKDSDSNSGVVLMTIHGSKGLEFPICYFLGLYNKFNLKELNDRFIYDEKYGIITPYYKEGIGTTFIKELLKNRYVKEEISEKIRLFYVALTRSKEKIIMITSFPQKEITDIKKSNSFLDFLVYSKKEINSFVKNIDLEEINLTKDYDLINTYNFKENIRKSYEEINKKNININLEIVEKKIASKSIYKLLSKKDKENINLGLRIHEVFEYADFKSDFSKLNLEPFIKGKLQNFISKINIEKVNKVIKEFEFIYLRDNIKTNGIIDLILEYDDHIKIVDYKLKNTEDYVDQLKNYKEYLTTITNKEIEVYLYSIVDDELTNILIG